jgi:hypothetical protein
MIMESMSLKAFRYYVDHQTELVERYNEKFIVIRNQTVIGAYDSEMEATEKTSRDYELGTFLVQKYEPGEESYIQTCHSRAVFA